MPWHLSHWQLSQWQLAQWQLTQYDSWHNDSWLNDSWLNMTVFSIAFVPIGQLSQIAFVPIWKLLLLWPVFPLLRETMGNRSTSHVRNQWSVRCVGDGARRDSWEKIKYMTCFIFSFIVQILNKFLYTRRFGWSTATFHKNYTEGF